MRYWLGQTPLITDASRSDSASSATQWLPVGKGSPPKLFAKFAGKGPSFELSQDDWSFPPTFAVRRFNGKRVCLAKIRMLRFPYI